jgi:sugar phosphate isomerase/epimerase
MSARIRIGNQTAVSCESPTGPFDFALRHGFDAFEWFEDKKTFPDGGSAGWDAADLDGPARAALREAGRAQDVLFTVHAPWQANPLRPGGPELLTRSIDLARDLGAALVNLHLYMDEGAEGYAQSLAPVARYAAGAGLRLSVENTPHTTPSDFNDTFDRLRQLDGVPPGTVGMCLDVGHANLCAETHNDFVGYLDALAPAVPIIHVHAHENRGDRDSHLTLFTGPSKADDGAIRGLLRRLRQRDYEGAIILEQWPDPPELLVEAAARLRELLGLPGPTPIRPGDRSRIRPGLPPR